jgi:hypothetical protein
VLERLWAVAHCFHTEGSEEARQFVEEQLRDLLQAHLRQFEPGFRRKSFGDGLGIASACHS